MIASALNKGLKFEVFSFLSKELIGRVSSLLRHIDELPVPVLNAYVETSFT